MIDNVRANTASFFRRKNTANLTDDLQNAAEMKEDDTPLALATRDRDFNLLFRDDDPQLVKERQAVWPKQHDWEVLLERGMCGAEMNVSEGSTDFIVSYTEGN